MPLLGADLGVCVTGGALGSVPLQSGPGAVGVREAHACFLVSSPNVPLNCVPEGEQGWLSWLLLPSLSWVEIAVFCAGVSVKRKADQAEGRLGCH